jgi:hypothetical protein
LQIGIGSHGFSPLTMTPSTPLPLLTYDSPLSNDAVAIAFRQHIGATEPLRAGLYGKALTFTLSTTAP